MKEPQANLFPPVLLKETCEMFLKKERIVTLILRKTKIVTNIISKTKLFRFSFLSPLQLLHFSATNTKKRKG